MRSTLRPRRLCFHVDGPARARRLQARKNHAVAKALEETLAGRSASGSGCKVAVAPEHNALILSGTTEQIQEVLRVVARPDSRPGR